MDMQKDLSKGPTFVMARQLGQIIFKATGFVWSSQYSVVIIYQKCPKEGQLVTSDMAKWFEELHKAFKVKTWQPNSLDPILIAHLWDVLDKQN